MVRIGGPKRINDLWHDVGIRKLLLALIAFAMIATMAQAVPVEEWNRTFSGSLEDVFYSVQPTSDGGYILAGTTQSPAPYGIGAWLIKTDTNGKEQWNKTFVGGNDYVYSVQQTPDGGYITAGTKHSTTKYRCWDAWLIKTDSNGNEQWNKTFEWSLSCSSANSLQLTSDGGYILAGSIGDSVLLMKTDGSGNEQWRKGFSGYSGANAYSVQNTLDGGYILAGCIWPYGDSREDAWLIKTDSSGNQQWNKTFGGMDWEEAYSVQPTSDGGYILAGGTGQNGAGDDAWLIKTDSNGNEQWKKIFGGTEGDVVRSIQPTSDGGYILAGNTWSYGAGGDMWLIKTDSNGNEQWNTTFGGVNEDVAYSVQPTSDGSYIMAGYTNLSWDHNADAWLVKVRELDWNPWNDPDSAGGESITLTELQTAIYDWRFGIVLSNGETVDLSRLQGLIYSWRYGNYVK